jgi:hypothetical protein
MNTMQEIVERIQGIIDSAVETREREEGRGTDVRALVASEITTRFILNKVLERVETGNLNAVTTYIDHFAQAASELHDEMGGFEAVEKAAWYIHAEVSLLVEINRLGEEWHKQLRTSLNIEGA